MAIDNLIVKEAMAEYAENQLEKVKYNKREFELVDRLNKAFPSDEELSELLDLLLNRYADLVTCDCGRKAFIEVICNACDREE
jgi:hypothetical protein